MVNSFYWYIMIKCMYVVLVKEMKAHVKLNNAK